MKQKGGFLLYLLLALTSVGGDHQGRNSRFLSNTPLLALPPVGTIAIGPHSHSLQPIGLHSPRFSLQTFQDPHYVEVQKKKLVPIPAEDLIDEEWKTFKVLNSNAENCKNSL